MMRLKRFFSTAKDSLLPQFLVSEKNGFLPRKDPLGRLPERFGKLEELLEEMPFSKKNGKPGLLAREMMAPMSEQVPEYPIDDIQDSRLLSALFRDYTFWASAYLLEPCHLRMLSKGDYGLGRSKLPRNIAVPLDGIAKKLGMRPFMEYALSYALYNWQRRDPKGPIAYDNIQLIRAFTGMPSESGFILVHVSMVAHSGALIKATLQVLQAVRGADRPKLEEALLAYREVMSRINAEMETMWSRSKPDDYKEFRTFIMGIKNQPIFPEGVLYEGVSEERRFYRGESGANDSIIPTADNLFQIYEQMPENPLTEILRDFRTYRPVEHNRWLSHVQEEAQKLQVQRFACQDPNTAVLLLANLDQVRDFRSRHWNFTKEYIIKHSSHPVATGGSPIVTWLPNQLSTVLRLMERIASNIDRRALRGEREEMLKAILSRMDAQLQLLEREVSTLQRKINPSQQ